MKTNLIIENGNFISSHPCDINEQGEQESNGSQEFIYELNGLFYSIQMDWEDTPVKPNRNVKPIPYEIEVL